MKPSCRQKAGTNKDKNPSLSPFAKGGRKGDFQVKRIILGGLFLFSFLLVLSNSAFADEYIIAHGENPKGKSYFAYEKLVLNKKDAGWQDANITNGIFEVVVTDGKLDVRFIDASKSIKSARSQGAEVVTLNKGKNEATIFVMYPAETIEVYTLYVDNDRKQKFIMTVTKSGDNALITQSSIFTGSCSFIDFDKFPE